MKKTLSRDLSKQYINNFTKTVNVLLIMFVPHSAFNDDSTGYSIKFINEWVITSIKYPKINENAKLSTFSFRDNTATPDKFKFLLIKTLVDILLCSADMNLESLNKYKITCDDTYCYFEYFFTSEKETITLPPKRQEGVKFTLRVDKQNKPILKISVPL